MTKKIAVLSDHIPFLKTSQILSKKTNEMPEIEAITYNKVLEHNFSIRLKIMSILNEIYPENNKF